MKNLVLSILIIVSSFSVFAQQNSTTDTVIINPKYKEIDNILKTDLPHHQQERNITDNSQKNTIHICAPSRANMLGSPLTIVKYGKKELLSRDFKNNSVLKIINPNDISSIDILKDKESIEKYGEDGKNGVIIVTIKDEKADEFAKALKQRKKDLRKLNKN